MNRTFLALTVVGATALGLSACAPGGKTVSPKPETTPAAEVRPAPETLSFTEGTVVSSVGAPERLTLDETDNGLPDVSPDGTRMVFQSKREGRWQVFVMNLEDHTSTPLFSSEANDENPVWSPDGNSVVFVSDRDGFGNEWERNLYRYELATGAITRLTDTPGDDWLPDFGPDGRLYFLSERGASLDLPPYDRPCGWFALSPNEGTVSEVLGSDANPTAPLFVGNQWIIYATDDGALAAKASDGSSTLTVNPGTTLSGIGGFDPVNRLLAYPSEAVGGLWLADWDSRVWQRVPLSLEDVRAPRFSPDGGRLFFTAKSGGRFQIFQVGLAP